MTSLKTKRWNFVCNGQWISPIFLPSSNKKKGIHKWYLASYGREGTDARTFKILSFVKSMARIYTLYKDTQTAEDASVLESRSSMLLLTKS